jgi:hypothetical protein
MSKKYSIVPSLIALGFFTSSFAQDLSEEQKQKHFMCKVTAGMALEATLRRDKGVPIDDAKVELEDVFTTRQNSTLKSFIDFTVAYAYKLNDFNANTNYSIWYASCATQLVFQHRQSVDIKYEYIGMVKEKILECEKSPGSNVRPNECVMKVMLPALATRGN